MITCDRATLVVGGLCLVVIKQFLRAKTGHINTHMTTIVIFVRSPLSESDTLLLNKEIRRMLWRIVGPNENASVTVTTAIHGRSILTVPVEQLRKFARAFGLTSLNIDDLQAALAGRAVAEYDLLTRGSYESKLRVAFS